MNERMHGWSSSLWSFFGFRSGLFQVHWGLFLTFIVFYQCCRSHMGKSSFHRKWCVHCDTEFMEKESSWATATLSFHLFPHSTEKVMKKDSGNFISFIKISWFSYSHSLKPGTCDPLCQDFDKVVCPNYSTEHVKINVVSQPSVRIWLYYKNICTQKKTWQEHDVKLGVTLRERFQRFQSDVCCRASHSCLKLWISWEYDMKSTCPVRKTRMSPGGWVTWICNTDTTHASR